MWNHVMTLKGWYIGDREMGKESERGWERDREVGEKEKIWGEGKWERWWQKVRDNGDKKLEIMDTERES